MDVMLLKSAKLDFGILIAVDRLTTGANAHNLRGLANSYVLACESGQPSKAEEYRALLLRELRRHAGRARPGKSQIELEAAAQYQHT
jgi:hypothetical protein